MHARELVELGALVTAHSGVFLRQSKRLSEGGIEDYWSASKCRLNRWARVMKNFSARAQQNGRGESFASWTSVKPVLEEILTSEVLTRIWTAIACEFDRRQDEKELEPVMRSVWVGHLEARNRALNIMVYGQGFSIEDAVNLNRLRRRCERWTDMLLGYLMNDCPVREFAFNHDRAKDFFDDIRHEHGLPAAPQTWQLVLTSLRAAFQSCLSSDCLNDDLNGKIASSILSCFGADLFDSTGILKSLWISRLGATANDTQGLIDELLSLDEHQPEAEKAAALFTRADQPHTGGRWRRL